MKGGARVRSLQQVKGAGMCFPTLNDFNFKRAALLPNLETITLPYEGDTVHLVKRRRTGLLRE